MYKNKVPIDPSPTPWDFSTWGFYCDTCGEFFDLVRQGRVEVADDSVSTYFHSCGQKARYIGYEREKTVQPHQERVVVEKKELDEKIEKLDQFRAGQIFQTLPADEQDKLNHQLSYMRQYSGVLADRIAAF